MARERKPSRKPGFRRLTPPRSCSRGPRLRARPPQTMPTRSGRPSRPFPLGSLERFTPSSQPPKPAEHRQPSCRPCRGSSTRRARSAQAYGRHSSPSSSSSKSCAQSRWPHAVHRLAGHSPLVSCLRPSTAPFPLNLLGPAVGQLAPMAPGGHSCALARAAIAGPLSRLETCRPHRLRAPECRLRANRRCHSKNWRPRRSSQAVRLMRQIKIYVYEGARPIAHLIQLLGIAVGTIQA